MSETGARPVPEVDSEPDEGNAAGGVDAIEEPVQVPAVGTQVPSAQLDADVPQELKEPEGPDSEANIDDPSVEPAD